MADVFLPEKRSEIMRKVKSGGNASTEMRIIKMFRENHITGWQRNYKIFGKPDFVFRNKKIALFCDGCFWHGHYCREKKPLQNAFYWNKKIQRNKKRDKEVTNHLRLKGWIVLRLWECEIKKDFQNKKFRSVFKLLSDLSVL